ncbi:MULTISPECIES: hypothetical protein [Mesorhizobium]|uniref:Abortive infection protein-like C-terminal domain-containing protein n=1 Tax=Mesorhizobium kowhaii TaxID=1300272 RepID=A0A2W7C7K1_9HYPH|nr:hypothetical protein [Mesorhizobium kowhaii]PZV38874.1 hypothetical protein B5V02_09280 [Mesorhizobium kowhaii]
MQFEAVWRFDSPGEMPRAVVNEFNSLAGIIASQGPSRKRILEHFKSYFSNSYGATAYSSSDVSWAESDLYDSMVSAGQNAPLFIDAFYEACEALRSNPEIALPDVARLNRVLAEHNAGYELHPPRIVATGIHKPIPVPERYESLDEKAQQIISESFRQSEQLLAEGRPRQAVAEILWLMESVVTAFRGLNAGGVTVEERYFNKIANELRRHQKGTMLEQVLTWLSALHGYLSSPTGGGVRHGIDLKSGITIGPADGRLYCNLIRSYVTFLMSEHERLSRQSGDQR